MLFKLFILKYPNHSILRNVRCISAWLVCSVLSYVFVQSTVKLVQLVEEKATVVQAS
jgi:hypothetical protein